MILSLLEAFYAKQSGAISWDEYIDNIFARCEGFGHNEDAAKDRCDSKLRRVDPFAESIKKWSVKVEDMEDASPLAAVFKAYRHGTLVDVNEKLAVLDAEHAPYVMGSLALLALLERQLDVLRFGMDRGRFRYDFNFQCEAEDVEASKEPETFNLLEQSEYRRLHPRTGVGAKPSAAAAFDVGGKLPVNW